MSDLDPILDVEPGPVLESLLLAGASVTAAAADSGFGSDETMRRAFLRHLDVTPTAYRNRFTSTRT